MESLPFLFFAVALIYSIAGFAGGSSYTALLAASGMPFAQIAPASLVCNLAVSSLGTRHFRRAGHLKWSLVLPFLAASIPMAYIGSRILVGKRAFLLLLGFSLAAAGLRLFLGRSEAAAEAPPQKKLWALALPLGAGMGLLSGVVGIGGGIFLSPLLILMRWATVKEASAAAAVFIFANSLSGFIGKLQSGAVFAPELPWLLAAAIGGGWIGSRLGSEMLPHAGVRRVLATLLLYVSFLTVSKAL